MESHNVNQERVAVFYVYLLRSKKNQTKTYIGFTRNLRNRLAAHNSGKSINTSHLRPWKLIACVVLDEEVKAIKLERYLKIGSGHAFAKKHLW